MRPEDVSEALEFLDEGMLEHALTARENGKRKREAAGKEGQPERRTEGHEEAWPEGQTKMCKRARSEGQKAMWTNRFQTWKIRGTAAAVLCLVCAGAVAGWLALRGGSEGKPPQEDLALKGQAAQEGSASEGRTGQEDPDREEKTAQGDLEPETPERFVEIDSLFASKDGEAEGVKDVVTLQGQRKAKVPLEDYVAVYEMASSADGAALAESVGRLVDGTAEWHYVSGHSDRQYLVRKEGQDISLWKFQCFDSDAYPYDDVLKRVYQIHSAEDILELEVTPARMDNSDRGKKIQEEIGTRSVTDRTAIEAVYEALSGMTCHGSNRWDLIDYGNVEGAADAGLKSHDAVRLGRYLAIRTAYGNVVDSLKYTAVSDMFYEFSGIAYEPLPKEQAAAVREALGIAE